MAEVAQALDQIRAPELRVSYQELLTAADQGEVPEELLVPLQNLLEIGLESGRIRAVHTAHGEMAARRIFARTPRGSALRATTAAVNEALQGLSGQVLGEVTLSANGPGSYSLSVNTDQGTVLIEVDRGGARIKSLEVG